MIYGPGENEPVVNTETTKKKQEQYVLNDEEIKKLAGWCIDIEKHYGKPMDIEWAKDGMDGQLYIIQARPETVHSAKKTSQVKEYQLLEQGEVIVKGQAIGNNTLMHP